MHIGIDFDNTIVCYDGLFHRVAVERGLVPRSCNVDKTAIRDYLRQQNQEERWTELQGYVYGVAIVDAAPFQGVKEFFVDCRQNDIPVTIISHRTRTPFAGPAFDLHQAAYDWLDAHGFHSADGIALSADRVYFEETKQAKLERIASSSCTHFIDDLPEFLSEASFPANVQRILFDNAAVQDGSHPFPALPTWPAIGKYLWEGGTT